MISHKCFLHLLDVWRSKEESLKSNNIAPTAKHGKHPAVVLVHKVNEIMKVNLQIHPSAPHVRGIIIPAG